MSVGLSFKTLDRAKANRLPRLSFFMLCQANQIVSPALYLMHMGLTLISTQSHERSSWACFLNGLFVWRCFTVKATAGYMWYMLCQLNALNAAQLQFDVLFGVSGNLTQLWHRVKTGSSKQWGWCQWVKLCWITLVTLVVESCNFYNVKTMKFSQQLNS